MFHDVFNNGIDGLIVNFRVAAIEVIDGVNAESDACTMFRKNGGDLILVLHVRLMAVSPSFASLMDADGHSVSCFTTEEENTIIAVPRIRSRLQVLVDGQSDATMPRWRSTGVNLHESRNYYSEMVAHEFGHLLG